VKDLFHFRDVSPHVLKVLKALAPYMYDVQVPYLHESTFERKYNHRQYVAMCPLCLEEKEFRSPGTGHKGFVQRIQPYRHDKTLYKVYLLGPWDKKLDLEITCKHSRHDVLFMYDLTEEDLFNQDQRKKYPVPDVLSTGYGAEVYWCDQLPTDLEGLNRENLLGWVVHVLSNEFKKSSSGIEDAIYRWNKGCGGAYSDTERFRAVQHLREAERRRLAQMEEAEKQRKQAEEERKRAEEQRRREEESRQRLVQYREQLDRTGYRPVDFTAPVRQTSYLVKGVIAADQLGYISGPLKSLKTGLALDLGFSAASQTPFLGIYEVPAAVRVLIFSGETAEANLRGTLHRIARSRGLQGIPEGLKLYTQLPQIGTPDGQHLLRFLVKDFGAGLVILDPLYMCLLDGVQGVSATNMFQMGPLIRQAARACLDAGATPYFVHHFTQSATAKHAAKPTAEPNVQDMAFAGLAESARQWITIKPRRPFEFENRRHQLLLKFGGSAGHCGRAAVEVVEGPFNQDDPAAGTWDVTVCDLEAAREKSTQEKKTKERRKEEQQDAQYAEKLLEAVVELEKGSPGTTVGFTEARAFARLNNPNMLLAVTYLVRHGRVGEVEHEKVTGSGAVRKVKALRRLVT
jgi:hypothetical protein